MNNCPYCTKKETLENFGYLAQETKNSLIIVFKDQTKPGRMVVAYKKHVGEIIDLTKEERDAFMDDVAMVANAIREAYHPDRINYGAYNDTLGHLHFHLCPKYKDKDEWGGIFTMNTGILVDEEECKKVYEKLKPFLK